MTEISAAMVKQLRDATSAGMMDCKRALQETDGDFDEAVRMLRERGLASAAKRAGRETTEGMVLARSADSVGVLVAVGCETEPVSKNDEFVAFAQQVLEAVAADGPDAAQALEDTRAELAGKLGENIRVVGAARFDASDGESLSHYVHPPANKIGVLVKTKGGTPELARQLAMHISFARPTYRSRGEIPQDLVDAERDILQNLDEVQSKPENVREKIVEGMLNKRFYAEAVLPEQAWIHETGLTVEKALQAGGMELVEYAWYSVS